MTRNGTPCEPSGNPASPDCSSSDTTAASDRPSISPVVPHWLSWSLIVIITLVFGAASLSFPFGRDQLYYAFIGDAILHGKTLYRDIPMMQMPMTGVVHSLALAALGRSMTAIRILDLFWTIATVGSIYMLVRKMSGRDWMGLTAGLLYASIYYLRDYWNTAEVDGFLNLPVALGLYFAFCAMVPRDAEPRASVRRVQLVAAGALLGLALLFKYTIGIVIPGLLLIVLWAHQSQYREGWRAIVWLVLGVGATLAIFITMLAITGGGGDFLVSQWNVALPYSREGNSRFGLLTKIGMMCRYAVFTGRFEAGTWLGVFGALLAIVAIRRHPAIPAGLRLGLGLAIMWLIAAMCSIFVQGKFFDYHYLSAAPPLAILGAFAVGEIFRPLLNHFAGPRHRLVLFATATVALAMLNLPLHWNAELAQVALGKRPIEQYWEGERFQRESFRLADQMALARYLGQQTTPSDRITCFGIDPSLSFPHWREPVMRFSATLGPDPKMWTMEPTFVANPPDVLIVPHDDRIPWVRGSDMDSHELLTAFWPMRDFVAANYRKETRIGRYDVLRQKN